MFYLRPAFRKLQNLANLIKAKHLYCYCKTWTGNGQCFVFLKCMKNSQKYLIYKHLFCGIFIGFIQRIELQWEWSSERKREKVLERGRERFLLLLAHSKMVSTGLGLAQARNQEFYLKLMYVCRGPNTWGPLSLFFPGTSIRRRIRVEQLRFELLSIWDASLLGTDLMCYTTMKAQGVSSKTFYYVQTSVEQKIKYDSNQPCSLECWGHY